MNYPKIYKLTFSKKYGQFFYSCCVLTLLIIWWFANYFLAIILSFVVVIYGFWTIKRLKNQINTIIINKENLIIDGKKVASFAVIFSNNVWTKITYKYKNAKNINLLIFNDSCDGVDIYQINKYLNFAIRDC